jgi:hypothetical protein
MGEKKNTKFWSENLKKKPLGRPRRRWEDIRMGLREVGREYVDWIHMAQDRDHWAACEHGNEPSVPRKGGGFLD